MSLESCPPSDRMTSRRAEALPRGFTLTELLTVIAIITLLIGIAIPSISSARRRALQSATKAQIQAIETGCEMFRNDQNEYPKSSALWFGAGTATDQTNWEVTDGTNRLQGANLIVDAMVGRDLQGHDPKVGTGNGNTPASRWYVGAANSRPRRQPYVEADRIPVSTTYITPEKPMKDGYMSYDLDKVMPQIDGIRVPTFLDKFEYPILYYRANPARTSTMKIVQSSTVGANQRGDGIYDGRDNEAFTSYPMSQQLLADANVGLSGSEPYTDQKFIEYVRSLRGSSYNSSLTPPPITFSKPVKPDGFILISPGPDGVWGNLDDVGNFDVLSDSR